MRHKYSPVISQVLGGPIQRDYEYERKCQEFREAKHRMSTIKKVIDNFPRKLEGHKQLLDTIVNTCEFIVDKNQKSYYQFMHNITSAHKALSDKLVGLFNQLSSITNSTNIWIKELNEVVAKVRQREECRKNYEHYEQKLYELNIDRMKEVNKKNKISESDNERFIRNIGKFQKAGKEYIFSSNSAYKSMENYLNVRYDRIVSAMVNLIEAERSFYNEANHIMNFFTNIRNNSLGLRKTLIVSNTKYDAGLFIKGTPILNMSVGDIFSSNYKLPPRPPIPGSSQVPYGAGGPGGPGGPGGLGQSFNNNQNNNNKGIINPFSADNSNFESNSSNNNNNNYNTFKKINTFSGGNAFNNQSTRDTFALSNPYNTQANPYSANNNMNNNFGGNNNMNNNYNTYDGNNNNNIQNPYKGNNNNNQQNDFDPYGGNNNEDPFTGNDVNPYDGNNNNNNINNNNQNPYDNGPNDNNQNNNNNEDEDPFDF